MTRTILVLDDDAQFRQLVAAVLEQQGYCVVEASTATRADEIVEQQELDFALIDQVLPDTTGTAWLERIRGRGHTVPAALVSAEWRDPEELAVVRDQLGVAWVATKPLEPTAFANRMAEHFGERRPTDDNADSSLTVKLRSLRHEYARRLPGKLAALRSMLRQLATSPPGPVDEATRNRAILEAHRIRGTAGSYDLAQVGCVVGTIEDALEQWSDGAAEPPAGGWAALHAALDEAASAAVTAESPPGSAAPAAPGARILVVDDDPEFLDLIAAMGRPNLLEVVAATNAEEALACVETGCVDAAMLDVKLGGESGFDVAHALRQVPACRDLPLAFVSVYHQMEERVGAVHAGAVAYLTKPVAPSVFVDAVGQLLGTTRDERPRVLIVEDDEHSAAHTASILQAEGISTFIEPDPGRAIAALEEIQPDLLLLDLMMPRFDGRDVCRAIRLAPRWQALPVVFLTVRTDRETRLDAYRAGGDDYLTKPIVPEELVARVTVRLQRARLLRDRSDRDPLTGLASRRAFVEAAEARIAEASRSGGVLSLCLFDLDHFKAINDTHGHLVGDRVLSQLGRLLQQRFRPYDLRGRWGGEEFVLLFPGERATTAQLLATRLLSELRTLKLIDDGGRQFGVTCTAGVAGFPADGANLHGLIATADERLYRGKAAGRDTVIGP